MLVARPAQINRMASVPTYLRILLVTARPDDVASALGGHREQLETLRRAGRLHAAWTLADGDGFVEAFEAADRHDAERVTAASPLVEAGLCSWTLKRCESDSG